MLQIVEGDGRSLEGRMVHHCLSHSTENPFHVVRGQNLLSDLQKVPSQLFGLSEQGDIDQRTVNRWLTFVLDPPGEHF